MASRNYGYVALWFLGLSLIASILDFTATAVILLAIGLWIGFLWLESEQY